MVEYLKNQQADQLDTIDFDEAESTSNDAVFSAMIGGGEDAEDELYEEAKQAVIEAKKASTSYLQRKLRVGYSRAARLMDLLEENGVIGPADGSKAREILATPESIPSEPVEEDEIEPEDDMIEESEDVEEDDDELDDDSDDARAKFF